MDPAAARFRLCHVVAGSVKLGHVLLLGRLAVLGRAQEGMDAAVRCRHQQGQGRQQVGREAAGRKASRQARP